MPAPTETIPLPPSPADTYEAQRWEQTRLRRRMLDGTWREDLKQRIVDQVGSERAQAWRSLDMSSMVAATIARTLSVLYLRPYHVRHEAGKAAVKGLVDSLTRAGLFSIMPRFQAWVYGCREYLMRVNVTPDGELHYRPVAPDFTLADSNPDDPSTPVAVSEARLRIHPRTNQPVWTFDVLDTRTGRFGVCEAKEGATLGADLSAAFLVDPGTGEPLQGWPDAYTDSAGDRVLPYILYHASRTGDRLWDYMAMREVFEGSLNLAVGNSHHLHLMKDASWPQRYSVNAKPVGGAPVDTDTQATRHQVVTDAATLLVMESETDESQSIMVGQWAAGSDVESFQRTLESRATQLAQDAGVPAGDVQRMGGTARSGYAIAMSNEGKREAQKQFAPQFARADAELVALSAILLNRTTGTNYPESGYEIVYQEIPLSPQELEARRTHAIELLDRKLMTDAQAYAYIHNTSQAQAAQDLDSMKEAERVAAEEVEANAIASGSPDSPAQDTALNGAQVGAAVEIVARVARGELTKRSADAMLRQFFNLSPPAAAAILADADKVTAPPITP